MHERDSAPARHRSAVGCQLARGDAHQGRFSGAVFADQAEDLAGAQLERHVIDGAEHLFAGASRRAERLRDVRETDQNPAGGFTTPFLMSFVTRSTSASVCAEMPAFSFSFQTTETVP
jgi:hypothetical protein